MTFTTEYKNTQMTLVPDLMNSGFRTYPHPPLSWNKPWFSCISRHAVW